MPTYRSSATGNVVTTSSTLNAQQQSDLGYTPVGSGTQVTGTPVFEGGAVPNAQVFGNASLTPPGSNVAGAPQQSISPGSSIAGNPQQSFTVGNYSQLPTDLTTQGGVPFGPQFTANIPSEITSDVQIKANNPSAIAEQSATINASDVGAQEDSQNIANIDSAFQPQIADMLKSINKLIDKEVKRPDVLNPQAEFNKLTAAAGINDAQASLSALQSQLASLRETSNQMLDQFNNLIVDQEGKGGFANVVAGRQARLATELQRRLQPLQRAEQTLVDQINNQREALQNAKEEVLTQVQLGVDAYNILVQEADSKENRNNQKVQNLMQQVTFIQGQMNEQRRMDQQDQSNELAKWRLAMDIPTGMSIPLADGSTITSLKSPTEDVKWFQNGGSIVGLRANADGTIEQVFNKHFGDLEDIETVSIKDVYSTAWESFQNDPQGRPFQVHLDNALKTANQTNAGYNGLTNYFGNELVSPRDALAEEYGFKLSSEGMRTDRHNNPIAAAVTAGGTNAFTHALEAAGISWSYGDAFPNDPNMRTIRIDNPDEAMDAAHAILANTGAIQKWYVNHTGKDDDGVPFLNVRSNDDYLALSPPEQMDYIARVYGKEGGNGSLAGFTPENTTIPFNNPEHNYNVPEDGIPATPGTDGSSTFLAKAEDIKNQFVSRLSLGKEESKKLTGLLTIFDWANGMEESYWKQVWGIDTPRTLLPEGGFWTGDNDSKLSAIGKGVVGFLGGDQSWKAWRTNAEANAPLLAKEIGGDVGNLAEIEQQRALGRIPQWNATQYEAQQAFMKLKQTLYQKAQGYGTFNKEFYMTYDGTADTAGGATQSDIDYVNKL